MAELIHIDNGDSGLEAREKINAGFDAANENTADRFANTRDSEYSATTAEELRLEINSNDFNQINYGTHELINSANSLKGVFNFANFAQQGIATDKIGFIFHHYTDSSMAQLDNVGSGKILVLKNARSPTRRPDKAGGYVGTGSFISMVADDGAGGLLSFLSFNNDGAILYPGDAGMARTIQNKSDDGFPAFSYECSVGKEHDNLYRFVNGVNEVLSIRNDVSKTRLTLRSHSSQTNGMMIETNSGSLLLNPASTIDMNKPFKPKGYATLPAVVNGSIIMYNGVPVYGLGGSWLYFSDDSVAV